MKWRHRSDGSAVVHGGRSRWFTAVVTLPENERERLWLVEALREKCIELGEERESKDENRRKLAAVVSIGGLGLLIFHPTVLIDFNSKQRS